MSEDGKLTVNEYIQYGARMAMSTMLGLSYGGDRDIYEALGYKKDLTFQDDFLPFYLRQDFAAAIINRPTEYTWRYLPNIVTPDDNGVFNALMNDLNLKNKFIRADRLSMLGRYSVMILGFSDITTPSDWNTPVTEASKLMYINTASEVEAIVNTYITDSKDPRYGLPATYIVNKSTDNGLGVSSLIVHWTRIIHITGETLLSDVYGIPYLQRVYNRLQDLDKLLGGSAEMFWRGARPGVAGKVDEGYELTPGMREQLDGEMKQMEHNLRRVLLTEGITLNTLSPQYADPNQAIDCQLLAISAVTGIPKRILTGSELGELASTQDKNNWIAYITTRRDEYAGSQIIKPLIDRLIKFKVIPNTPYSIEWQSLDIVSVNDRMSANKAYLQLFIDYTNNPATMSILPFHAFLKNVVGMSVNEIEVLLAEIEQYNSTISIDEDEEGDNE